MIKDKEKTKEKILNALKTILSTHGFTKVIEVIIPKLETNTIKHYCRDVALQRLYEGKYCRF